MSEIALFPLSSVLLPSGRMSLQIFEQRYLDLVAHCMRESEGFGVVWLQQGSEVSGGSLDTPNVGEYGTLPESSTGISSRMVSLVSRLRATSPSMFSRYGGSPVAW